MDKSKTRFAMIIMLVVFFLGVGYALVNSVTLNVTGTGTSKTQELEVIFKEETIVTNSEKVVATKKEDEDLSANLEVKNLKLNETVAATYTVQNKELDVHANLVTTSIVNSNPEYFKVTTNLKENDVVQFNYKGYILTHRIIEVKDKNDELKFVTKGDNNQNTDFPDTEKYQIISKVEYIVPAIGDFVALIKKI